MAEAFLVIYHLGDEPTVIRGCLNSQSQARVYIKHLIANKFPETPPWRHIRGKDTWTREVDGVTETLSVLRKRLHHRAQTQITEDADIEAGNKLGEKLKKILTREEKTIKIK